MAAKPQRTLAHDAFNRLLRAQYVKWGEHSYDMIEETARRIHEIHPDFAGAANRAGLSRANICKIIKGTHGSLPTTAQLSRLVLAQQYLAYREHVAPEDPGCSTLPLWHGLLAEAKLLSAQQEAEGLFVTDDDPIPAGQGWMPGLTAPPGPLPAAVPTQATPVRLTPPEIHYLTGLGAHSWILSATTGAAEPLYEVAVMLGAATSPYNARAAAIAVNAAAAGLPVAADLISTRGDVDPEVAARQARVLAYAARKNGDLGTAQVFTTCADRVHMRNSQDHAPRHHD